MNNDLIIVGGFHEIIELGHSCNKNIVGIIDNKLSGEYFGYKILGGDDSAEAVYKSFKDVRLVISPDNPKVRLKLANYYSKIGFKFGSLISPRATISRSAKIGEGVVVQTGVNISALVTIGNFVKLNSLSNVMHDSFIGNFVTIAPNAVVLGRVKIFEFAYIGANATILPGLTVGKDSVVGAGTVVRKNVNDETLVVDNLTKSKKESN